MKINWSHYLDHQRWVPMLIVLVIGLVGGFAINMAFGDELEMLGIIIASVLGGVFLCLLSLVFYVLRQIQQRARWEKENFQILLHGKLEAEREQRLHGQLMQAEEKKVFLAVVQSVFAGPAARKVPTEMILKSLEAAMELAVDSEKPLTVKLTELQALVDLLEKG